MSDVSVQIQTDTVSGDALPVIKYNSITDTWGPVISEATAPCCCTQVCITSWVWECVDDEWTKVSGPVTACDVFPGWDNIGAHIGGPHRKVYMLVGGECGEDGDCPDYTGPDPDPPTESCTAPACIYYVHATCDPQAIPPTFIVDAITPDCGIPVEGMTYGVMIRDSNTEAHGWFIGGPCEDDGDCTGADLGFGIGDPPPVTLYGCQPCVRDCDFPNDSGWMVWVTLEWEITITNTCDPPGGSYTLTVMTASGIGSCNVTHVSWVVSNEAGATGSVTWYDAVDGGDPAHWAIGLHDRSYVIYDGDCTGCEAEYTEVTTGGVYGEDCVQTRVDHITLAVTWRPIP